MTEVLDKPKATKLPKWTKAQQAEHRKLWIDALRSGEYKQTTGTLREKLEDSSDGFCCLGVACDLFAKTKVGKKLNAGWMSENPNTPNLVFEVERPDMKTPERQVGALPKLVQDWLGLDNFEGTYGKPNEDGRYEKSLVTLNDEKHYSFKKIASVIAKEPKGLIRE